MAHSSRDTVLPIPIFLSGGKHFIFSVAHASFLRAEYRIAGVLTGTLPQSPQQNVFLGLPLQLMAEEARLLVRRGVCFVVDDAAAHREGLRRLCGPDGEEERLQWLATLREMGLDAARARDAVSKSRMERALGKMETGRREQALRSLAARQQAETRQATPSEADSEDTLFPAYEQATPSPPSAPKPMSVSDDPNPLGVTPTTSHPPLPLPFPDDTATLPPAPPSYPLFAYLHSHPGSNYFSSPGLRFGCQYLVYPGDPLRFHSHFLAVGYDWDEEFDLLSLIGGGRLGTGVKKGFLIGGTEPGKAEEFAGHGDGEEGVRCFCIEWGGM
ncbi:hypothetical protein FH972_022322 [Carpinus fangiana]|uniref:tRNA-splicing endonuclease subunit Sen34 n=1 Tax=Carpinus fangiana TaxID=176857 RepID=A0A5N6KS95_9ROSI|nr:hypothetical protein FH972_022322 [Carpinus fangiana]